MVWGLQVRKQQQRHTGSNSALLCCIAGLTLIITLFSTTSFSAEGDCTANGGDPKFDPCEELLKQINNLDPGSIVIPNSPSAGVGNPISLVTGNKYQKEVDHQPYLSGTSTKLVLLRHYNSLNADTAFGFGPGWSMSYDTYIAVTGERELQIVQSDGRRVVFRRVTNPESNESKFNAVHPSGGYVMQNEKHYRWYMNDGRALYFNNQGYLTRIHHQKSDTTLSLTRNAEGWVSKVQDDDERTLQFEYFDKNDALANRNLDEISKKRIMFLHGRIRQVSLPDNTTIQYNYDSNGNLNHVTKPDKTKRTYHYEDARYPYALTGITNENNTRYVTWGYDQEGRAYLSEHANNVGRVTLEYQLPLNSNDEGHTITTNSLGQQAIYTWKYFGLESQPLLISSEGIACSSCPKTGKRYQYNENFQVSQVNYKNGIILRYKYDSLGRLSRITREVQGRTYQTPEQLVESFEYVGNTHLHSAVIRPSVNPEAHKIIAYNYNEHEQLVQVTESGYRPTSNGGYQPVMRTTKLNYDGRNLIAIDGPRNDVEDIVRLSYDKFDRITELKSPGKPVLLVSEYDEYGRPIRLQQKPKLPFEIQYNLQGLPTLVRQGTSHVSYIYDSIGNITKIESSTGKTYSFEYDEAGRGTQLKDNNGIQLDIILDNEDRIISRNISTHGQQWKTLSYLYDAHNRLQTVQDEGGNQLAEYGYDQEGHLSSFTNSNGIQQQFNYGPFDQLHSVTSLDSASIQFKYNQQSQQFSGLIDSRNNKTEYIRDDFGNVLQQNSADSGKKYFEYDVAGNLIRKQDADGSITTSQYDAANRLVFRESKNNQVSEQITISYDTDTGQLSEIKNGESNERFIYTETGKLTKHIREIDEHTFTTEYEYHAETNKLIKKYLPDGQTLRYHYHASGKNKNKLRAITRENFIGQTTIIGELNTSDNKTSKHVVHGNGIVTDYKYGLDGKLLTINSKHIPSFNYQYDIRGNIIGINKDSFNYDLLNRITQAKIQTQKQTHEYRYEYDSVGNRIKRIKNDSTTSYNYRSEGQGNILTSIENENDNSEQQYFYNQAGSPKEIGEKRYVYNSNQRPIQYYVNNQLRAEYSYNAFGERIKKVIYANNQKQITYYLYDGQTLTAEANEAGEITSQYIYHEKYQPIAKLERKQLYAIHTDHLGTPRAVTDEDRNIVWSATYSPFGEAEITQPNQQKQFSFNLRFPGQYFDQESNKHYNYFRDYDPNTGRYLTSDPIGLKGGVNTFAYVNGNPLNAIDPLGLQTIAGNSPGIGTEFPVDIQKPTSVGELLDAALELNNIIAEQQANFSLEFLEALGEDVTGLAELLGGLIKLGYDSSPVGAVTDFVFGDNAPAWLPSNDRGEQTINDLLEILGLLWDDPWLLWEALKEPYAELWEDCELARIGGRASYDGISLALGYGWLLKLGKLGKLSDVLKLLKKIKSNIHLPDNLPNNKFPDELINDLAKLATNNPKADNVMLGKWDGGSPTSYIDRAGDDFTYYNLDNWNDLSKLVDGDPNELWKINKKFLDDQHASGKEFYLSHDPFDPENISPGTFYRKEIEHLTSNPPEGLGGRIEQVNNNTWKIIF